MASRRQKPRQGAFERDPLTPEQAANAIYGDVAALEELERQRVIIRPVTLDEITIDPEIQVRVGGLDEETVEKYVQILLNGGEFADPIILYRDEKTGELFLADGFHRVESDRRGLKRLEPGQTIKALRGEIRPGGREGALEEAEEANLRHGKELSTADKRNIFERRVKRGHEWTQRSDRDIAALLGVDRKTIGNWRRAALSPTGEISPVESGDSTVSKVPTKNAPVLRVGADGKVRDVSNIQRANQSRPAPKPMPLAAPKTVRSFIPDDELEYEDDQNQDGIEYGRAVPRHDERQQDNSQTPPSMPDPGYDDRLRDYEALMRQAQQIAGQRAAHNGAPSPAFENISAALDQLEGALRQHQVDELSDLEFIDLVDSLSASLMHLLNVNPPRAALYALDVAANISLAPDAWRSVAPDILQDLSQKKKDVKAMFQDLETILLRRRL